MEDLVQLVNRFSSSYLIRGQPNAENQHLLGDQCFEDQHNQVYDDGISTVAKASQAISNQASANGIKDDWWCACTMQTRSNQTCQTSKTSLQSVTSVGTAGVVGVATLAKESLIIVTASFTSLISLMAEKA